VKFSYESGTWHADSSKAQHKFFIGIEGNYCLLRFQTMLEM